MNATENHNPSLPLAVPLERPVRPLRPMVDGELWSAVRDLLNDGGALWDDLQEQGYEVHSAHMDARAADLAEKLQKRLRAGYLQALRPVECSHTGMSYGDDKAGGPSDYTRGWGDCLKAVKAALGLAA